MFCLLYYGLFYIMGKLFHILRIFAPFGLQFFLCIKWHLINTILIFIETLLKNVHTNNFLFPNKVWFKKRNNSFGARNLKMYTLIFTLKKICI